MFPHVRPATPAMNGKGNNGNANNDGKAKQNKTDGQDKGNQDTKVPSAVAIPAPTEGVGKPTSTPILAVVPEGFGWILDSGSGYDIVADQAIKGKDRENIKSNDNPARLTTANGELEVSKSIALETRSGLTLDALVMEDSPCVLSLGRRCMVDGFSFTWEPYKLPCLISPDGTEIALETKSFVPCIACPKALVVHKSEENETTERSDSDAKSIVRRGRTTRKRIKGSSRS